jgi:hypothetical protein
LSGAVVHPQRWLAHRNSPPDSLRFSLQLSLGLSVEKERTRRGSRGRKKEKKKRRERREKKEKRSS